MSQIDQTTQATASSAEETASAAEELADQSESMRGSVEDLLTLVGMAARGGTGGGGAAAAAEADFARRAAPVRGMKQPVAPVQTGRVKRLVLPATAQAALAE